MDHAEFCLGDDKLLWCVQYLGWRVWAAAVTLARHCQEEERGDFENGLENQSKSQEIARPPQPNENVRFFVFCFQWLIPKYNF